MIPNNSTAPRGPQSPFVTAFGSITPTEDEELEYYRRQLAGKLGLGGVADLADSLAQTRSKVRGSLAGLVGIEAPEAGGPGSAAKSAVQGAVKAGAQGMAKNVAKKAMGAL